MLDYKKWLEQHVANGGEYVDARTYAGMIANEGYGNAEQLYSQIMAAREPHTPATDIRSNNPEIEAHHLADIMREGKAKGLGDTIHDITHATGLYRLADLYAHLTGKSCGCEKRREWLNDRVPYGH